jgi:DNA-binding NarL/FixJ family response regulator
VVLDPVGDVFALVSGITPESVIYRIDERHASEVPEDCLAFVGSRGAIDWQTVAMLAKRSRVVIVAARALADDAVRALAIGAFGYVDATMPADALARTLRAAIAGEPAYSRRVVADWVRRSRGSIAARAFALTPRQREVVSLVATGAADKEIAQKLGIATGTAQKHVTNALRRLDVPNRAAAAAIVGATAGLL